MSEEAQQSALDPLHVLVGAWATEMTHPAFGGTIVTGSCSFEWLEGRRFLLQRSVTEHPDFPDSLSVVGVIDGERSLHYFDSRGVFRVYSWAFDEDGAWRIWRDGADFDQRFAGGFEDAGDTLAGLWQMRRDDGVWNDDLRITFRRA